MRDAGTQSGQLGDLASQQFLEVLPGLGPLAMLSVPDRHHERGAAKLEALKPTLPTR